MMMSHPHGNGTKYPLRHGGGVAAGSVANGDTVVSAIIMVNVVGANGCRADEAYAAPVKQLRVTVCAGAHDECIGITYCNGGEISRLKIFNPSKWLNLSFDVRYVAIYYDSHNAVRFAAQNPMQPAMNTSNRM